MFDAEAIRADFPILSHSIYNKPLIYFDNGATTQKPRAGVEQIEKGYYNVTGSFWKGLGLHFAVGYPF